MAWQPQRMDWIKERFLTKLWAPNYVHPDRMLFTIYIEPRRLQTKTPFIFSLTPILFVERRKELCAIWVNYMQCLFLAQQIAYKKLIQLFRLFKTQKFAFHFLHQCPQAEHLLLNILHTGSDMYCIPPTGWRLCCSLSNISTHPSLSLCEGVGFLTRHRHTL